MVHLRNADEIAKYFRTDAPPLYYFCYSAWPLVGLRDRVADLRMVLSVDVDFGAMPQIFSPERPRVPHHCTFLESNRELLFHPEVASYVEQRGPGHALLMACDQSIEDRCAELGLPLMMPTNTIRQAVDDRNFTTRLGERAGVRSVPHVLAQVRSYAGLRQVASHLGPDLVLQTPFGDSGTTTFFVSSEADWDKCAASVEREREVKVMKRIRCREATLDACVTRKGVIVGPMLTEIVGFSELVSLRGGWVGNEIGKGLFSESVRRAASELTATIGAELFHIGYRGTFGADLLLDEDTGDLYLGEINPRITGATPLTSIATAEAIGVPLLFFHLLEFLGIDHDLDVAELNSCFRQDSGVPRAQLVVRALENHGGHVYTLPYSGHWRLNEQGAPSLHHRSIVPSPSLAPNEAFMAPLIGLGEVCVPGDELFAAIAEGRFLTPEHKLTPRALAWNSALRATLEFEGAGTSGSRERDDMTYFTQRDAPADLW